MKPFLKLVAEDLYRRFNGRFENIAVVFPNKRAGLFFNEYLLDCSGKAPIWSPQYMTISELFQQNSRMVTGDTILLVGKLYREYVASLSHASGGKAVEKGIEPIDAFWYWGEMLLRDFDDIDKNLADAKMLFTDIKDLRALGNGKETLDEEQTKAVARFFENFNCDKESKVKSNFQDIWERLYNIYSNFKERLREDDIAYEGMLYRDVIENGELVLKHDKYVFVGFNALNGAETELFKRIEKCGKALFYWDYDRYYTDAAFHEAGHFMRKNLKLFPNALDKNEFRNLEREKSVTIVSAGTDSIETRYVSTWLDSNLTENNVETAIVLCDETMLEPVLHTIPANANGHELKSLNVTMGFPISHTPIYSLMKHLVELQTRGWSEKHKAFGIRFVCNLLKHPYVIQCSQYATECYNTLVKNNVFYPTDNELHKDEFLKLIFSRMEDNGKWLENIAGIVYAVAEERSRAAKEKSEMYELLFSEAILKVYTQIKRFRTIHAAGELEVQQATAGRLLLKVLSAMRMPFHGEPVAGLQIMGLLETRNLDFRNVIVLGVNEGNLPKNSGENSYIPYNLRRAFGLTLSEHRDSIYAYYLYRLLQRAENVTLVYNTAKEGKNRGECSRYILQLLGSDLYSIKKISLSARQKSSTMEPVAVEKTAEMIKRLRERFDYGFCDKAMEFSPSAVNKYINCGLSFFYYYILGLKPIEEIDTELKATDFGTIFHSAAEMLYERIREKSATGIVTANMLEHYIDNDALLYEFINQAFKKEFFKGGKVEYDGEQYINRGVLHNFLLRLVKMDAGYCDFRYVGSEKKIRFPYVLKLPDYDIQLNIGGKIDRIDIKGDTVNIVDYKTGSADKKVKVSLDDIFGNKTKSAGNRLQSFLYSIALDEILKNRTDVSKEKELQWIEDVKVANVCKVSPTLLYMRKSNKKDENDRNGQVVKLNGTPVNDIGILKQEYLARLNDVLEEIFDVNRPFVPAEDHKRCEYCDYRKICGR